jgi:hypothetical protein
MGGKGRKPGAHCRWRLEYSVGSFHLALDGESISAKFRQDREHRLVGGVVADEDRGAVRERLTGHQLGDGRALVEILGLNLDDGLAEQRFNLALVIGGDDGLDLPLEQIPRSSARR